MREKTETTTEDNATERFTFSLKEKNKIVEWKEAEKEFRYKDEMYDVVKAEVNKDSVTYFCLHDNDEEHLISNFEKLIKNNNLGNNGKSKTDNIKELSKYNLNNNVECSLLVKQNQFTSSTPIFYHSRRIEVQSPPPKFFDKSFIDWLKNSNSI